MEDKEKQYDNAARLRQAFGKSSSIHYNIGIDVNKYGKDDNDELAKKALWHFKHKPYTSN